MTLASMLRKEGFNTEIYFEEDKLNKQFSYADKKGIPIVIIEGPDEIKEDKIGIKNMIDRTQINIPKEKLIETIRDLLSFQRK